MGWTMVLVMGMLIVKADLLESGASITCQAEADQVGGEGYVLCRFAFDLSLDRSVVSFTVEHMAPMSKAEDSKQLLDCTHLREDRKTMKCTRLPAGYDSYNISGSEVVINMSNVGQQHMGQYNCLLLYDGKEIPPAICKLKINGVSSDSGIGTGGIIGIVAVLVVIGAITAVLIWRKPCNRGTADNAELPLQDGVNRTGERNDNGGAAGGKTQPEVVVSGDPDRRQEAQELCTGKDVEGRVAEVNRAAANDNFVPSPGNITTGSPRTKGPADGPETEVPPEESVEDHGHSAEKDPLMSEATGGKPEFHRGVKGADKKEEAEEEEKKADKKQEEEEEAEEQGKDEAKEQEQIPLVSSEKID